MAYARIRNDRTDPRMGLTPYDTLNGNSEATPCSSTDSNGPRDRPGKLSLTCTGGQVKILGLGEKA